MLGKRSRMNSARLVRDVEIDAARAGALHLGVDRAGDDVARRERTVADAYRAMNSRPCASMQDAALAAHRLGDRETMRACGMKEAGRVKLDELHVGDRRAGAPRHRHAVAGRDRGIGRVRYLPQPPVARTAVGAEVSTSPVASSST